MFKRHRLHRRRLVLQQFLRRVPGGGGLERQKMGGQSTPHPTGAYSTYLYGVSCPSPSVHRRRLVRQHSQGSDVGGSLERENLGYTVDPKPRRL